MKNKLIPKNQNGGNIMGYNYIGKVDKKDIPYYQKDIDRYANIPEVTVLSHPGALANSERSKNYSSSFDPNGFENFINVATLGGLNNLSPTQWARRGYDAANGKLTANSWFNGNNGIVSNKYAQDHPILSSAVNLLGDAASIPIAKGAKTLELGKNLNPFDNDYSRRIVYYNREPYTYNDRGQTVKDIIKDFISGKQRDIDKAPWSVSVDNFGSNNSKARVDAWRMYNRFPQKYGTFERNADGTYTAQKDIDRLTRLPVSEGLINEALEKSKITGQPVNFAGHDFVNGVGGTVNTSVQYLDQFTPKNNLRTSIRRGVITNTDVWDLNPFTNDQILNGVKSIGPIGRFLANTKIMKYAANKAANFEVGQIFGSKPFKVVNPVPITSITQGSSDNILKGFDPNHIYPQEINQYNIKNTGMNDDALWFYKTLQK